MKQIFTFCLLFTVNIVYSQVPNPDYDSTLAKKLSVDESVMKTYVLAILKTGPNTTTDKSITDSLFAGHMKNINRLADDGKLIIAGPLKKNDKTYRGIFVLNVDNIETARALVATDPAVKAGIFDTEFFIWYCTAALQEIPDLHKKISKFIE